MTRADAIREIAAEYPEATLDSVANCVENRGFDRPSRQAIESALAKSGTRGRPSSRDKCPTCGQRVDDLSDAGICKVYTDAFTGAPFRVKVREGTVATMSQKPRTKRTRRTPKAPRSKRKAK